MNDLFLVAFLPILVVVLATIYSVFTTWLEYRDHCSHKFTRWTDPIKEGTHPHQLRHCTECNLYQQRLVQ